MLGDELARMFGSSSIYQGHKNTRSLKVCNNNIMELHPNAGRIEIETFKQERRNKKTVGYYLVCVPAKMKGMLWLRWPCKGQVRSQCYNGFADEVSSFDCRCETAKQGKFLPNNQTTISFAIFVQLFKLK